MYCIKCGVKLAESEKECPLCQTRVFHPELDMPDGEPPYPRGKYPAVKPRSLWPQACISILFLLPILIVLLCDLQLSGGITWSGYVIGAVLLGYVIVILPFWFRKPNMVIFVPCDFVAIGLYLLYIDLACGGSWFLSFAFPVTGGVGLIFTTVVVLSKYVPKGRLFTFGGAFIALGIFSILMEFLQNLTFDLPMGISWSPYVLIVLAVLGGLLIYLGCNRSAREMLARKLFI